MMAVTRQRLQHLWQHHAPALLLALLTLLFAAAGEQLAALLRYQRSAIIEGEWWRVVTGHLVHLGWPHLLMNLAGLVLIWLLFGRLLNWRQWLLVWLLSSLSTSLGLWWLETDLEWYVGLSGVLHGLFVAGAMAAICRGYRAEIVLLLVVTAKLLWETSHGPLPGSSSLAGGEVIVAAHLYGAIGGLLHGMLAMLGRFGKRWRKG
ncbi:MAG: rhombosortase [Gammaproteobacteria bacterium]|nr:rhombosortase [Gammaproteobacteria bacterium]